MKGMMARRDLVMALLIAAWAHVGLFFVFVVLMASNLLSGKIIEQEDPPEEIPPAIRMQMVYEESAPLLTPVAAAPLAEPEVPEKVDLEDEPPAFVQTKESQSSEKPTEETPLIGERDTVATSDEGAVAGDDKMAALSGEEDRKSDPKTFDSNFSEGDTTGPNEGIQNSLEAGKGNDEVNEELAKITGDKAEPMTEPTPKPVEETPPVPKGELASIDEALAMLEEEVGDGKTAELPVPQPKSEPEKVEETMPERPTTEKKEAKAQDGGFATRARKTRIAGVISANGKGSLNVSNTAIGRYQAAIFKKLETSWQMENIRNRSLLAPGNVTLYFVVDQKGKVSRQKQMAMVGASGTQWGMILRALSVTSIPKMPKDVIKELEGDPLEIVISFNYH